MSVIENNGDQASPKSICSDLPFKESPKPLFEIQDEHQKHLASQSSDMRKQLLGLRKKSSVDESPLQLTTQYRNASINPVRRSLIIKGDKEEKKRAVVKKRLVFNTYNTQYSVIDVAARNVGFKTVYKDHNLQPSAEMKAAYKIQNGFHQSIPIEEFDVVWFDLSIKDEVLQKLKPH